ncbi:hypothetical protein ACFQS3_14225 [Glycomyces mayteni]|uniref:Uncharacterized protein n=1 Tax=Glycomyces mayteni TaxID=543887 RepID=A0ABW2D7P2_9ACTN
MSANPSGNPALRKAAKRAVMAGTAAVAVTSLVKRRLNPPEPPVREEAE